MPRLTKSRAQTESLPAVDREWVEGSLRALGYSIAEVSREVTGHKDLLLRTLERTRRLKIDEAISLSRKLDVPLTILLSRFGYDVPAPALEVYGTADATGVITPFEGSPPLAVAVAVTPSETTYRALFLEGQEGPERGLMVFDLMDRVFPALAGALCVLHFADANPVLGRFRLAGARTLVSPLGGSRFTTAALEATSPVRWRYYATPVAL